MSGRIKVRADFSFFAFNAVIFLLFSTSEVLCFYSVCLVHELGHLLAMLAVGERVDSVTLSAFGIVIKTEKQPAEARLRSLLVLLAGPAVNLIIAAMLMIFGNSSEAAMPELAAAVYNLLPYRSLDGGAALALFYEGAPYQRTAEAVLLAVKLMFSVGLLAGCVAVGTELLPVFVMSVLLLAGEGGKK